MKLQRLSDRVGILSVGNGLTVAVQLLVGVLLARLLAPAALGSYFQVTLVVATLSPILFLGIPSSLYYLLPLHRGERRDRVVVQSYLLLGGLGLVGAAAVGLSAGPLSAWLNNPELGSSIARFGLALVGMLPAAMVHPLLVSRERYVQATLFGFGVSLAEGAVVVGAVAAQLPLQDVFLALAGLHIAVGLATGVLVVRAVGLRSILRPGLWRERGLLAEQLHYAVPFAAAIHVGTLNRFLDRYLIGSLYAPALFAVYAVGAREVPIVPLLVGSINVVLQQQFTSLHRDGRAEEILPTWHAATRKQALAVLPLAALLFVVARPFITGLYSDRYQDSVPVFRVYLGLLVLQAVTWPLVLMAVGRSRALVAGSAVSVVATAAVGIALIGPLGLLGPAVGAVAGQLAAAVFYLARTRRLLGTSWGALLPWASLLAVAGSAAGAGLVVGPLAAATDGPLGALAVAAAYALVFALLGRASGALRGEDLGLVYRWVTLEPILGGGREWRLGRRRA